MTNDLESKIQIYKMNLRSSVTLANVIKYA